MVQSRDAKVAGCTRFLALPGAPGEATGAADARVTIVPLLEFCAPEQKRPVERKLTGTIP